MTQLVIWTVLSLVIIVAAIAVYVVSQAWLGLMLGIRVERVAIGFDICGLRLLRWRGRHWEWLVGILPMGGYTTFVGSEETEAARAVSAEQAREPASPVTKPSTPEPPPGSILTASRTARLAIYLVGPLSNIALGMICLVIPIMMGSKQLVQTSSDASMVRPCAVSGLTEIDRPTTFSGQMTFFADVGKNLFRKIVLFRPLEGWGGYLGCLLTCGAAAVHSWSLWMSCLGLVCVTMGLINLLPIPTLNGGHIAIGLVEAMCGRRLPDALQIILAYFGLILVLVWLGRLLIADVLWLPSAA
jgi:membrane-associated protease RseP (regulator of RpoE activity)